MPHDNLRSDDLIGYWETSACRRQVLLAWFGEKTEPCGNCDNCLNPVALADRTNDARHIVEAIQRTGERFGAAHIINILQGVESEKREEGEAARSSPFAGRTQKELRSLIRQLVAGGFLDIEIGRYGGLTIAQKGHALLHGEQPFYHRAASPRGPTRKEAREALAAPEASLLDALKRLRLAMAKQRRMPPYLIFSDRTLIDMAKRRPRDVDEFAEVNGVGASKLKNFATPFLTAIREHEARGKRPA
jgi:ATP-dependent DNA helicase RecQ